MYIGVNVIWLMTPTVHMKTKKKLKTKCLKNPLCAIFSESREFKDINITFFLLVNQTRLQSTSNLTPEYAFLFPDIEQQINK